MNRKEAYFEFSKIVSIDNDSKESYVHKSKYKDLIVKIYDSFEKDLKDINNQVSRLKKQLSKGHHIECSCSFCKPVDNQLKEDLEDYNKMLINQNNKCDICRIEFNNLVVDHCHTTGKVRGLLCNGCNSGIGFFKENKVTILNSIEYLNKHEK